MCKVKIHLFELSAMFGFICTSADVCRSRRIIFSSGVAHGHRCPPTPYGGRASTHRSSNPLRGAYRIRTAPGDVQRRYVAGGADGARILQHGRATAAADVQHPLAGAPRGEGEQRLRHRRQRDVGLLVSRHPALAARAVRGLPVLLAPASLRSPPLLGSVRRWSTLPETEGAVHS
jgi:hypothetical protein